MDSPPVPVPWVKSPPCSMNWGLHRGGGGGGGGAGGTEGVDSWMVAGGGGHGGLLLVGCAARGLLLVGCCSWDVLLGLAQHCAAARAPGSHDAVEDGALVVKRLARLAHALLAGAQRAAGWVGGDGVDREAGSCEMCAAATDVLRRHSTFSSVRSALWGAHKAGSSRLA